VRLTIKKERLTLVAVDSNGQARILGQAQLKLGASGIPQTLELSEPCAETDAGTPVSNVPGKGNGARFAVTVPSTKRPEFFRPANRDSKPQGYGRREVSQRRRVQVGEAKAALAPSLEQTHEEHSSQPDRPAYESAWRRVHGAGE